MKGGRKARTHWVPLAPQASELLRRLKRDRLQDSDWVFSRDGVKPVSSFGYFKTKLDQALAAAGVTLPGWVIHDWRRSFVMWATEHAEEFQFAAISVADVADMCLGHDPRGKVQKTYNPHNFAKERRILLAGWAKFLTGLEGEVLDPLTEAVSAVEGVHQSRVLPVPKSAPAHGFIRPSAQALTTASVWDKFRKEDCRPVAFAYVAYDMLRAIASHHEVIAVLPTILNRDEGVYTEEFLKKGPLKSEMGRVVADLWLHCTATLAIVIYQELEMSDFSQNPPPELAGRIGPPIPRPTKRESADLVREALLARFKGVYNRSPKTFALAFANAAADARLTRWMYRERKAGSDPEHETAGGELAETGT